MQIDEDKKKIDGEEEEAEGGATLSESALEAFDEGVVGDDSIEALAEKELEADEEEDASAFFDVAPEDRW